LLLIAFFSRFDVLLNLKFGFYGYACVPFVVFVILESSSRLAAAAAPLLYKLFIFIVFEMFISIRMVIWNACVY